MACMGVNPGCLPQQNQKKQIATDKIISIQQIREYLPACISGVAAAVASVITVTDW